jgi:alpha-L-arabinofuranosidase
MLDALDIRADFFAVHNAYAPVIIDDSGRFQDHRDLRALYLSMYSAAAGVSENLDALDREIAKRSPRNAGVPYAITEHGPFLGLSQRPDTHAIYVDQTRTLGAAIYVASLLDALIGDRRVFMGCYTNPIHKWYGSLLTDTGGQLVLTPTYFLYQLYLTRFEPHLLAVTTTSSTYAAQPIGIVKARSGVPHLVARASISDNRRKVTAMLVNRSPDRVLETTVSINGFRPTKTDCRILTADTPAARNGSGLTGTTTAAREAIEPRPLACSATNNQVTLRIPSSAIVSVIAEQN